MAHHINNPLTSIIGEVHLLLQNLPKGDASYESAELIEKAGWRVQEAVQRILDVSRPAISTLENINVNKTIHDALTLVSDPIQANGIDLEIDLADDLPEVYGNARQLSDLWSNLLLLARDATSDGFPHTIRISSQAESEKMVAVEVWDDGSVISKEDLARLFEPDFLKPVGERGTGVEFSICNEIVQQHHGQINATSDQQHGTILRVSLGGVA